MKRQPKPKHPAPVLNPPPRKGSPEGRTAYVPVTNWIEGKVNG